MRIIAEQLRERDTLEKLFDDIETASSKGSIAFYPCNKFLRDIIGEMKQGRPDLLQHVFGGFDKSDQVNFDESIKVYPLSDIDTYKDHISLLVIASNNFPSRDLRDILTQYAGPLREISNFDISLSQQYSPLETLEKIRETYDLLEDDKSKITYLLVWLYSLLQDEQLSHVFDREEQVAVSEDMITWKEYVLHGLGKNLSNIEELHYEIYKMKEVYPQRGDVVFDIGAYVGDTAAFFDRYVGETGVIYAFEPIPANFKRLQANIAANPFKSTVIPVSCGCGQMTMQMNAVSVADGAPWSFLTMDDGVPVDVVALDDFIRLHDLDHVDFVKMDVEGHEKEVLLGAKEMIRRFTPKMAVCLYHKTEDLFELPLLIRELGEYKLYIRCTKGGPFGTILYCLPREEKR